MPQALQVCATIATLTLGNGEERGQPARVFLERFDSKELDAARRLPRAASVMHRSFLPRSLGS
jgi:hypothetical protein